MPSIQMGPQKPIAKSAAKSAKGLPQKAAPNPIQIRKEKSQKASKQVFKGLKFSFSGNFLAEKKDSSWTYENMARWITVHGGSYESVVTDDTTHLICTLDAYKKKTTQVRNAVILGPACTIVTKDWLDDCLIPTEGRKMRLLPDSGYTLNHAKKRVDAGLEHQKQHRIDFGKGGRAAYNLTGNNLYHVYCDDTGFSHEVVLVRFNEYGSTKCEKYCLYLFESNAAFPRLYMSAAKYSKGPGHKATSWRDECRAKTFKDAFADFKKFFHGHTGVQWDDRCDGAPYDDTKFKYALPLDERPVGVLPDGKKRPGAPRAKDGDREDVEMITPTESIISDSVSGEKESSDSLSSDSCSNPATHHSFAVRAPSGPLSPISISSDSGSGSE